MVNEILLLKSLLVGSGILVVLFLIKSNLFLLNSEKMITSTTRTLMILMSCVALICSFIEIYYVFMTNWRGEWFEGLFYCSGFFDTILCIALLGVVQAIHIAAVSFGLTYIGKGKINQRIGALCLVASIAICVENNIFSSRVPFELGSYGWFLIPIVLFALYIIVKFWISGNFITGSLSGAFYFINAIAIFFTCSYCISAFVGILVLIILAVFVFGGLIGGSGSTNKSNTTILDENGVRHNLTKYDGTSYKDENGEYWRRSGGDFKSEK